MIIFLLRIFMWKKKQKKSFSFKDLINLIHKFYQRHLVRNFFSCFFFTSLVFIPGYLEGISWACIPRNYTGNGVSEEPQFLKAIVKPFTRLIVQVNFLKVNYNH